MAETFFKVILEVLGIHFGQNQKTLRIDFEEGFSHEYFQKSNISFWHWVRFEMCRTYFSKNQILDLSLLNQTGSEWL